MLKSQAKPLRSSRLEFGKLNRMARIRAGFLLCVLFGLAGYAWRESIWRNDVKEIEAWLEIRADRRALKETIALNQKWGKTGVGYLMSARAMRHIRNDEGCREALNRAAMGGVSHTVIAHESRLLAAQSGQSQLTPKEMEEILANPLAPFHANADALLNGLLLQRRDYEFVQLLQLWSQQEPGTFWIDYHAGLKESLNNEQTKALKLYQKAHSINPKFIPLWMAIGRTYWFLQAPEKAIEFLERVVEVEPDYDEANSALSQSLVALGRFKEAEVVMRPFIDLADVCSDRARQQGMVLIGLERYQDAIDAMTPAVRAWPNDVELNRQLAESYQNLGDEKQAVYYSRAAQDGTQVVSSITLRKRHPSYLGRDPNFLAQVGHDVMHFISRVEGRDILEEALTISDLLPQAHADLATFYLLNGDTDAAKHHRLRALTLEMDATTKAQE